MIYVTIFFFVWTYYEMLIRKAMLECLPDGIEVHDAVYSKMIVDTNYLQDIVFERTGYNITIS